MKSVFDVADYILRFVDRDAGDMISALKLQKLVYYTQAWSLAFRSKPLFPETIEAWKHGPVVPGIWAKYADFKHSPIPAPEKPLSAFDHIEEMVIEEVWETYGERSAKTLEILTHREPPWLNARKGLDPQQKSENPIRHSDMRIYYVNFLDSASDSLRIQPRAIEFTKIIDAEAGLPLEDLAGMVQELQLSSRIGRYSDKQHDLAQKALDALKVRQNGDIEKWANRLASDVADADD